ncbi:hypothetical protein BGX34_003654 [Mortierella sp. NVP85]|nr:hypothetical protein BGX34_003654 [Mortierella sp. NVP85]
MASSSLFRAVNVGKKKDDGTWLFRNVNIELQKGILTITGPSGVGKSTLLKCINQILTMDEGQVYLQDKYDDRPFGVNPNLVILLRVAPKNNLEPTSALDEESCNMVENTLGEYNCIWITHNPPQAKRISTAGTLTMRGGDNSPSASPLGIFIEEDGLRGHGKGNHHENDVTHDNNNNNNNSNDHNGKERRASAATSRTNASTSSTSKRIA